MTTFARRRRLFAERLEDRMVLSAIPFLDPATVPGETQAFVMAGKRPDSPAAREDANDADSAFGGVGSLFLNPDPDTPFGFICTGTAISPLHVLTAAHCVDADDNGSADILPENIFFVVNALPPGENPDTFEFPSHVAVGAAVDVHPDFTGFANPSPNDDAAIVTLAAPLPGWVPTYGILQDADALAGAEFTLIGYGLSGHLNTGVLRPNGPAPHVVPSDFTVKRIGKNVADAFLPDDETGAPIPEVFCADVDPPDGNMQSIFGLGGTSLGNGEETSAAPGDSGGPAMVEMDGQLLVGGINTFGRAIDFTRLATYQSLTCGTVVPVIADWINGVIGAAAPAAAPAPSEFAPFLSTIDGYLAPLDAASSLHPILLSVALAREAAISAMGEVPTERNQDAGQEATQSAFSGWQNVRAQPSLLQAAASEPSRPAKAALSDPVTSATRIAARDSIFAGDLSADRLALAWNVL